MKRPRAVLLLSVLLAAGTPFAACFPSYTYGESATDGGTGDDATLDASDGGSTDATADGMSTTDAPGDSPIDVPVDSNGPFCPPSALDGSVGVSAIVETNVATASGLGQPVHLVVASNDCTAWYFFMSDDGSQILTRTSSDFVTWTDGDAIALPQGALPYGEDFSVALARINGVDVVHVIADVVTSGNYSTFHIRTTIVGGHLTTPTSAAIPGTTNGSPCEQDAPAVIVSKDGHVYDSTGWTSHASTSCDLNIYKSNGVDDGTTFDETFTLAGAYYSIPTYTFAHQLVELPEAGAIIAVMPDQDNQTVTNYEALGVAISPWDPNDVPSPTELFDVSGGPEAAFGDWGLCRLSDTDVRAIRHVFTGDAGTASANAFQSKQYPSSDGGWQTGPAPPASTQSAINSGLAVVGDRDPTHGIVVATIGANGQSINLQRWTSTGWHALPSLARGKTVQAIAGSGCGSVHPAVFWTEGATAPYTIETADLSSAVLP